MVGIQKHGRGEVMAIKGSSGGNTETRERGSDGDQGKQWWEYRNTGEGK